MSSNSDNSDNLVVIERKNKRTIKYVENKLAVPEFPNVLKYSETEINLPPLYKKSAIGKTLEWKIKVQLITKGNQTIPIQKEYLSKTLNPEWKGLIITLHGQQDGKRQESKKKILRGKNLKRSNETNVLTQALLEAVSAWTKEQERKGYTQNLAEIHDLTVRPMLLKDYHKEKKRINWSNAYAQPKLDGIRALIHYDPGTKSFRIFSRTGLEYHHLSHLRDELSHVPELIQNPGIWLDGELFTDQVDFNNIVSIVRKTLDLSPDEIKKQGLLEYHIFDTFDLNNMSLPFEQRIVKLDKWFPTDSRKFIFPVQTIPIKSEAELLSLHKKLSQNYEGTVIRLGGTPYSMGKRTNYALKLKDFILEEFPIVDCTDGVGKDEGLIIYVLKNKAGKTFAARPRGSLEERAKLFKECKKLIGKMVTVRFTEYTPDGVPRFPVALTIRDYE